MKNKLCGAWLEGKELGELKISKGINKYRVEADGKYFYFARSIKIAISENVDNVDNAETYQFDKTRDLAYENNDIEYFKFEIEKLKQRKLNRSERRENRKRLKKMMGSKSIFSNYISSKDDSSVKTEDLVANTNAKMKAFLDKNVQNEQELNDEIIDIEDSAENKEI